MTHLLAALPAALATARWRILGRGGALSALLAWVWATDTARWLLLPHIGSDPVLWALVDMLWVSWYIAHVLVLTDKGRDFAGLTLLGTCYFSWGYLLSERWMGPAAARDIWLTLAGGAWSGAGLIAWSRQPAGLEQVLGMASAGLSLVQVLHFYPPSISWITHAMFYAVSCATLTASLAKHLIKERGIQ